MPSSDHDPLAYQPLRAPQHADGVLAVPAPAVFLRSLTPIEPRGDSLVQQVRGQVAALALEHTCRYRDVNERLGNAVKASGGDAHPTIWLGAGHQPRWFHPGVWIKNFALSQLASEIGAIPVNLIIDNDLAVDHGVSVPIDESTQTRRELIPWCPPHARVPFEDHRPEGVNIRDFVSRVTKAMQPWTREPILGELASAWHDAVEQGEPFGHAIAATRHTFEGKVGLQTLEAPLGRVFELPAVTCWAAAIIERADELHTVYNEILQRFRRLHGIRSRSHPVADLAASDEWRETPFWIWHREQPRRRGLWVRSVQGRIQLTNRQDWVSQSGSSESALLEAQETGWRIRPRALMTTLFARTALFDGFIHGIGGAKYDQLTDALMEQLLGVPAPQYLTMTATVPLRDMHLEQARSALRNLRRRLRDTQFNPQRELSPSAPPAAHDLAAEKRIWLDKPSSRERHEAIKRINQSLQPFVAEQVQQLESAYKQQQAELRHAAVLGSRETSFCLFDRQELPQKLLDLAKKVDKLSVKSL